jgi:putative transposase
MDTQRIVTHLRLAEWAELVRERIASGQSVREFCEAHKIHQSTYYHRQKRVREAALKAMSGEQNRDELLSAPIESKVNEVTPTACSPVQVSWAQISEAEIAGEREGYLIVEVGEYKVKVTNSTDMELLAKTCRTLASLC